MTVTSVLLNFRSALLALLPSVERVGISWKRPDAYDDWDALATTLFETLVVMVFRWSLPDDKQRDFRIPSYDLLLASYAGSSTLEVTHPSLPAGRWLFHAFGTTNEPFDVVEVREVSAEGLPYGEDLATYPVDGARFRLRLFQGSGASEILDEVEMFDE